jgi:DNA-binding GntR family transcriptional regulator
LDAEFHGAFILASQNAFIISGYNIIALRVQAFRNRLSLDAQNWRSLDEHTEVEQLIRAKKTEPAAECLRTHIRAAFTTYLKRIKAEGANVA